MLGGSSTLGGFYGPDSKTDHIGTRDWGFSGCGEGDQDSSSQPAPDLIIHNAKILSVEEGFSIAEVSAIKDGEFVAVGTDTKVLAMADPKTRVVDLEGRTVLPGFNDMHSHVVKIGLNLPASMDLTSVESIADIQEVVAEHVAKSKPGEWILSEGGWWQFMLADGRLPNRHDLDPVSPDNPVVLRGGRLAVTRDLFKSVQEADLASSLVPA